MGRPQPASDAPTHPITDPMIALGKQSRQSLRRADRGARRGVALHDVDAAVREIGEVAALSRRSLGDVRAAVSNYREVTLAGELATGRELLRSAGITAEMPPAVDVADDATQELFGWVLREGLTNVVRHSHASTCTVRITSSSVEITDDGTGAAGSCGNGLTGLAGRVTSAGGLIEVGPNRPSGWRLAVQLGTGTSS